MRKYIITGYERYDEENYSKKRIKKLICRCDNAGEAMDKYFNEFPKATIEKISLYYTSD